MPASLRARRTTTVADPRTMPSARLLAWPEHSALLLQGGLRQAILPTVLGRRLAVGAPLRCSRELAVLPGPIAIGVQSARSVRAELGLT